MSEVRREVVVIKFKANGRGNRFGYSESYLSDVVRRRGGGMARASLTR